MKQNKETKPTQKSKTFNAQHSTSNGQGEEWEKEQRGKGEEARSRTTTRTSEPAGVSKQARIKRPAPVEVIIDVEVVIDEPILERVMALFYPAIPGSYICPEHGLRCRNWRRKRCELNLPNSTPHPSSQWLPKPTTSQVPDMGKSLRDPWSPIEAERVCERVMRKAISTELLLRLIYASPEQFAAVESVLGIEAENGAVMRNA